MEGFTRAGSFNGVDAFTGVGVFNTGEALNGVGLKGVLVKGVEALKEVGVLKGVGALKGVVLKGVGVLKGEGLTICRSDLLALVSQSSMLKVLEVRNDGLFYTQHLKEILSKNLVYSEYKKHDIN